MFSLSVLVNNLVLISFCPQKCLFYIILTWVSSVALYILIAMPDIGFHFNVNGLMICEAYFRSNVALVLTADFFYFPTTMILMYCYGTGMLKWVFRMLFHFFYSLFPEKLEAQFSYLAGVVRLDLPDGQQYILIHTLSKEKYSALIITF